MKKRKIIMDVDTGTDDALALMMAMLDDHFDLLGITTVNGNLNVDLTTDNSLRVVELCGKQDKIKVYKGCAYPIASTLLPWTPQHQVTPRIPGSTDAAWSRTHPDCLPLPNPSTRQADESAVVWLINTLLAAEDDEITLVPVGPLTNIAVALRADPRIIPKIKEMVIMAGGYRIHSTTTSPCSEFNVWIDPEAMEIVTQAGCKITMVPLDATHDAIVTLDDAKMLREIGTDAANFFADVIEQRADGYSLLDTDMKAAAGAPLHDALAVCAVIYPEVLTEVIHCNMRTDISRGYAYGQYEVTVGCGPEIQTVEQLHEALQTARQALAFRFLRGADRQIDLTEAVPEIRSFQQMFPGGLREVSVALEAFDFEALKMAVENVLDTVVADRDAVPKNLFEGLDVLAHYLREAYGKNELVELERVRLQPQNAVSYPRLKAELLQFLDQKMREIHEKKRFQDEQPIRIAKRYVEENFSGPVSLEETAAAVGLNPNYFSMLFKKMTDRNFSEYVTERRIDEARLLLRSTTLNLTQIADAVGYKDAKYFSKLFTKSVGLKPNEYRKLYS